MMGRIISTVLSVVLMLTQCARAAGNPIIIIVYADDVVYGDLGCYGETPDSQVSGKDIGFRQCFCPKKMNFAIIVLALAIFRRPDLCVS